MRTFLRSSLQQFLIGAATLCLLPAVHAAEQYPSKPITVIIPYAAGGPADSLARALARDLESQLKQPVIVESKAGGGATIGTSFVARSRPDGYTLLVGTSAGHVVTPLMQPIAYDGVGDFTFIGMVANQPNMLVVNSSLGINSLQELIAAAKKDPAKFNYASAGTGGATHLGAEALWQRAQVHITHVPYAGASPAIKDLLGGQVQLGNLNLAPVQAFLEQGRLKALAYGSKQRSASFPNVPTLAEAGYPDVDVSTWYSLAAPKGTPANIIDILGKAVARVNADPAYQKFLATQGAERMDMTPAQTTAFVQHDKEAMTKLLGSLNLIDQGQK